MVILPPRVSFLDPVLEFIPDFSIDLKFNNRK